MHKPTRFRNDQASTLDLIFIKEEEDVCDIDVLPGLGNSDHGIVKGTFICEWKSRVVQKPRRLYQKGDYTKIIQELDKINWESEFENKTVEDCWSKFRDTLETLVQKGFHALGFWSFRATHDVLDSGRLSRSEGRRFLASPKS